MKKIPDNAKLVFKGVLHDVYQWDQEMYDGTIALFEALKRRDGSCAIAVSDNRILINKEEQPSLEPFIAFPGGVSDNDDYLANAKKELLEETGYESNLWSYWFTADVLGYYKLEWNTHFFIAKDCKKVSEQKLDSGEKIDVESITFDEFLELRNNQKLRDHQIKPLLEKAASSQEEKQKLKDLLGITT